MGADHALGWFGFKAVSDFCNCGSHGGVPAGVLVGWRLLLKVGPLASAVDGVGGAVSRRLELWMVEEQAGTQWRRVGELVGAFDGPVACVGSCACGGCCLTSQSMSVDTVEVNQPGANQGCVMTLCQLIMCSW